MEAVLAWAASKVANVNAPRIEKSDEGFIVNKSLAWTMLIAIITASIWVGNQVATVREQVQQVRDDKIELQAALIALEARVRPLENGVPETRAQIGYILESIRRIEKALNAAPGGPE